MEIHNISEVTQEELDAMKKHHRQTEYSTEEANQVVNLVRKYINVRQPSCMSCHSNLRDAKTSLNTYYLNNKEVIEARLSMQTAATNVEEYAVLTEKPKRKNAK